MLLRGDPSPGSEPAELWMVRRRSTVRFRKRAPGRDGFSFVYPVTAVLRTAPQIALGYSRCWLRLVRRRCSIVQRLRHPGRLGLARAFTQMETETGTGAGSAPGGAAAVSWRRGGLLGLVLRRVLWLPGLDASLQGFNVGWHFLLCLAADDERDEQLADAVPVEVDRDGQPGTGFGQGFHGDIDGGADGPVDAPHAPCPGCVDVGELGGDGPVEI